MIHWIRGAKATFGFELRRALTWNRFLVAVGLAIFPPMMLSVVVRTAFVSNSVVAGGVTKYSEFAMIFLVALVCILSLLLWATPNVQSELEGKTWNFIAVRPGARIASFLGKYLLAVAISLAVSCAALAGCILVANSYQAFENPLQTLGSLAMIYAMACAVYGAIFSAIGTIFIKRAMVVAAGFMIGLETFMSLIPAVVSKLTMSYHLRSIGLQWIGNFLPETSEMEYNMAYGQPWPVWIHITCIAIMTVIALTIGMIAITQRQYVTADQT
jgi:ABC-type multidrug transport system permease subunit